MEIDEVIRCNQCGEIFPHDELQLIEENGCYESDYGIYDEFDSHTYYSSTNTVCPYCGSDDYTEGYICNECENFVKYLDDEDYGLCENCVCKYTDEEYEKKYPRKKSEVKDE